MKILTIVFLLLLNLKLIWNIWIPCSLERQYKLSKKIGMAEKPGSVSLMAFTEILCLFFATIFSAFTYDEGVIGNPIVILVGGVVAITLSYIIAILLTRWIRNMG